MRFVAVLALLVTPALCLWPAPRQITTGSTALRLSGSFDIALDVRNPPDDLQAAVSRTEGYIKNDKLQRLVVGRGATDAGRIAQARSLRKLVVKFSGTGRPKSISEEAVAPLEQRDEAYTLRVPADGSDAALTAKSSLGLLRGLTTFSQIWYVYGRDTYTVEAPFAIEDSPAFPYRGFMLDTSRNYYTVSDIKRTLDAMSWVKINTLHWHIVDSQSFPLEVEAFPEISRAGAYTPESVYTKSDLREIVAHASARGVDILVEIDTPGHTAIIAHSHPEHIACPDARPWIAFANQPPAGQLRLANDDTIAFTSKLFDSVVKQLPGSYFSSGGDEINSNCYAQDAQTQAELAAKGLTFEQALDVFTQKTHATLLNNKKTPVVWQEMLLNHNVTLDPSTVVLVWISSADAKAVASRGHRLVHAPNEYFYLDCGAGGWLGANPQGNSWCDPFKTWQRAYSFDPYQGLTTEEQKLVLGGQQLLWSEQSDPSNLDPIAWPRAAASAEVFWSGANPNGSARNGTEAFARLHDLRYRLVQRGVRAVALQPLWCALRPHACDL